MVDTVVPPTVHHETDPAITGRGHLAQRQPDDVALVVRHVVQRRAVREVVNLHAANMVPVELQRLVDASLV
jgi:hypothetical protein